MSIRGWELPEWSPCTSLDLMVKLVPDPGGQGEGDEGGEEGAPAGAVRKEHTCKEKRFRNEFTQPLPKKQLHCWQFKRTVELSIVGRQGNLKAEMRYLPDFNEMHKKRWRERNGRMPLYFCIGSFIWDVHNKLNMMLAISVILRSILNLILSV